MTERIETEAYFLTQEKLFAGQIDEWGNIKVCGTTYINFGGVKSSIVDNQGDIQLIKDIWVNWQDYNLILGALLYNEVEV
ncbi:hypothetical protein A3F02_01990 [Candidatus Curtissbacteria bacterium RIFCSPHIGHO2_12_FULL_38_9b]|uniref:YopX protein domain-containing protein n=2 Tax=Candidatus Curtissiibacteriota TaxID=1752717 RepID=A0A1F5GXJ3_9BACT|nr:MAG: hypothetical protein A3A48_00360 [Candidatus Curtissbacteria bacterium RIFCSPLOWO2_01_FULL_37_9]OGD96650.1 MAG: hypothetical protein A3F02_01990 [Candidatus Curtissbacteria bacterium RIFCSPHIGHO2_12_FULL_38_9b]